MWPLNHGPPGNKCIAVRAMRVINAPGLREFVAPRRSDVKAITVVNEFRVTIEGVCVVAAGYF